MAHRNLLRIAIAVALVAAVVVVSVLVDGAGVPSRKGAPPPSHDDEPEVVAPSVPRGSEEHTRFVVECLTERGFHVEGESQQGVGVISAEVSDAQAEVYSEAWIACNEEAQESLGVRPPTTPSVEQLGLWYDAFILTNQCLIEHGYPTVEPPSKDVFIDRYVSSGSTWHPYDAVPEANLHTVPGEASTPAAARGREIRETCTADLGVLIPRILGDRE